MNYQWKMNLFHFELYRNEYQISLKIAFVDPNSVVAGVVIMHWYRKKLMKTSANQSNQCRILFAHIQTISRIVSTTQTKASLTESDACNSAYATARELESTKLLHLRLCSNLNGFESMSLVVS